MTVEDVQAGDVITIELPDGRTISETTVTGVVVEEHATRVTFVPSSLPLEILEEFGSRIGFPHGWAIQIDFKE